MKSVVYPWKSASIMFFTLGLLFLILPIVVHSTIHPVFFMSIALFITGICFNLYSKRNEKKLERLKDGGLCYNAEIVRIIPNYLIRIRFYLTACVECSYRNHEGKTCLVKSGYYLLDPTGKSSSVKFLPRMYAAIYFDDFINNDGKNRLNATVYVNPDDPADYFVEVSEKTDIQYDHDYRI